MEREVRGLICLLLAILSSAMVSIVMRLSGRYVKGSVSMLAMNYLMCLLLGSLFSGVSDLFPRHAGLPAALAMGAVNGVLYLLGFVLLQVSVRRNGVVLSATFMKLGLLVPMAVSVLAFGEVPRPVQVVGFCIAVGAILLIHLEKQSSALGFKAGLILLLLAGGGGDAMSKVFEELGAQALAEHFLFYTFLTALLLCVGLTVWKRERPGWAEVGFGLLIGIPNYFSARFLLLALKDVAAVIVYPTYSVAAILVVTLTGVAFFRERLGRRQWLALGAILAALLLLNI